MLAVRESWLRRRATARTVPCTFLGKHLRFSHADLVAIAAAGAHPVGAVAPRRRAGAGRARAGGTAMTPGWGVQLPLRAKTSVHIRYGPHRSRVGLGDGPGKGRLRDGVGRAARQPQLAGPLPPRGRHHRRDQRLPHQDRRHRPRQHPGVRPTRGPVHRPRRREDHAERVWSQDWLQALDVAIRTEDFYRSLLRRHILPRWGEHGLVDISGIKAAAWAKDLRGPGYSAVTVAAVMKLLSLLLADAAEERLIPANPIRVRHRGRRRSERRPERIWATPAEVSGRRRQRRPPTRRRSRGGDLDRHRGLDRGPLGRTGRAATPQHPPRHRLTAATSSSTRTSGPSSSPAAGSSSAPPKTAESARTITLPPFLIELLRAHLATHTTGSCSSPHAASCTGAATSAAAP